MPNVLQLRQRAAELKTEVSMALKDCEAGIITPAALNRLMDRAEAEDAEIASGIAAHKKALRWGAAGAPETGATGPHQQGSEQSGLLQPRNRLASPMDLTTKQLGNIFEAGRRQLPTYSESVPSSFDSKAIGASDVTMKDAITEGVPGSLLPPTLQPTEQRVFEWRIEPTRVANFLVAQQGVGQAQEYVQWTGNAASPAAVKELGLKPDIGPELSTGTVRFEVIAALASLSKQLWSDFGDLQNWLPRILSHSLVNEENRILLSGSGTSPEPLGLLNFPGILTRAHGAITGDTELDTVRRAFNDIRVGEAFAEPDLLILNPSDLMSLQLLKSTTNLYVLQQDNPTALTDVTSSIFGVRAITTTQCPEGTALALNSALAATLYVRSGIEFVLVGGASGYQTDETLRYNKVIGRIEERLALAPVWAAAACKITGLSVPAGS
jgi:HK97 family phage major capsid protein